MNESRMALGLAGSRILRAPGSRRAAPPSGRVPWFAVLTVTLGAAGLAIFFEGARPPVPGPAALLSVHASILAGLLLAHSAVLYVFDGLVRSERLGRAASLLAAIGAAALIAASLVRWVEASWLLPGGTLIYAGSHEALTWLAALAAIAYLVIEDFFHSRIAGGLVLPLVAAALGLAAWLVAVSPATDPGFAALLGGYLDRAAHVAATVGFGSFVLIGATAAARRTGHRGRARAFIGGTGRAAEGVVVAGDPVLLGSVGVGLCAVTLALVFDLTRQWIPGVNATPVHYDVALAVLGLDLCLLYAFRRSNHGASLFLIRWAMVALLLAVSCWVGRRMIAGG
jgi:hypothetical protein